MDLDLRSLFVVEWESQEPTHHVDLLLTIYQHLIIVALFALVWTTMRHLGYPCQTTLERNDFHLSSIHHLII